MWDPLVQWQKFSFTENFKIALCIRDFHILCILRVIFKMCGLHVYLINIGRRGFFVDMYIFSLTLCINFNHDGLTNRLSSD